nr:hypothetical protein [Actinosynnema sp. ALI-1.44]
MKASHQASTSALGVSDRGELARQMSRITRYGNQRLTIGMIQPPSTHPAASDCDSDPPISSALVRARHIHITNRIPTSARKPSSGHTRLSTYSALSSSSVELRLPAV